jgi:hypothetical protein
MFRKVVVIAIAALALLMAGFATTDSALAFVTTAVPTIADPATLATWQHHFVATAAIAVPAVTEKGGWSIRQWCAYRCISVTAFYKMRQNGTAPTVTHPKGGPPRIMVEADAAWLKRINSLKDTAAEEERRAKAVAAGTKAAKSPKHVSNRTRSET